MIENQAVKNHTTDKYKNKKQNERTRNREKDRRIRGNRKYGQAKLKHAKKGIASCMIALIVFCSFFGMLMTAYFSGGNAAGYIGGIGLCTMILSGIGIYCATKGFKEREKDYLTCKIGIGCNIFFLLGFIAIFFRRLF